MVTKKPKKLVEFCIRGSNRTDEQFVKSGEQYDHLSINVFIGESSVVGHGMAEEAFYLKYQRHTEMKDSRMQPTHWYGEHLSMPGRPLSGELYDAYQLFLRMERFQDALWKKDLALGINDRTCALQIRVALLKAVGAREIFYSRHRHQYCENKYEAEQTGAGG